MKGGVKTIKNLVTLFMDDPLMTPFSINPD